MRQTTKDLVKNKWHEILPALGVSSQFLKNKHGPCPICGGADRFRFDDRGEGSWICNQCGAGDGFDLLIATQKKPFREISKLVQSVATNVISDNRPPVEKNEKELRKRQEKLWHSSVAVVRGDPVDLYLRNRLGGRTFQSESIRVARLSNKIAMVSKVAGPEGHGVNLHLTWITDQGTKADVPVQKQLMAGSLPAGSAIRLSRSERVMGIAEGVETAISAHLLFQMPVWCAINANNLMKWNPPHQLEELWIFGDRDQNYTGQAAAYHLAQRLAKKTKVIVHIPADPYKDFNDVLVAS